MKIFTLLSFCFLPFISTVLLAKPILSTFSGPADTLFAEVMLKSEACNTGLSPNPDTASDHRMESLTPTVIVINDFCGQGSGSIDITPDPNTPGPWVYHWSNLETTQDLTGLTGGTYTITIVDANGDEQIEEVVVNTFGLMVPPLANAVVTGNTVCVGNHTGALDVTVIPLTAPWTYLWSTGATTQDVSGLTHGTYTVSVTVGVSCTTIFEFIVPDNAGGLSAGIPGFAPSTCEREDGATGVIALGGLEPYTYLWSNGATTLGNQNIFADTYTVTVTDANGCTATSSITVGNVNYNMAIEGVVNVPNTTCIGANGGIDLLLIHSIILSPSFTYLWSNGATTQDLTNVPSGTYFVTVTFNPACFFIEGFYIDHAPAIPTISINNTNTTCGMSNGFINLTTLFGGTPPYTYLWSNGATTQDLFNVPAGDYEVTITGTNGCTFTHSATINDTPILFGYSALVTDQNACDTTNGEINLSLFPANLAYQWSNGATTKILKNLAPGTYTVTISAGGTCTAVGTYEVGDVREYPVIPALLDTSTCGLSNGAIDLVLLGNAAGPVTYLWSNGATTQDLSGILADTFHVTVTSAVGCSNTNTFIVPNFNDTIRVQGNVLDNVSCLLPTGNIALDITPFDSLYTYLWSGGQTTDSLSNLPAGTYLVTVTLGVSCIALDTFAVINSALPPNLSASGSSTNCGLNNGAADLTVNGGTGPFAFAWSNTATTEDLSNLTPGTYSVTVTGSNSCTAVTTVNVLNNNIPLSVNGLPLGNTSCAAANGSLDISITPAGTYNYAWSNAETTEDLNNLSPGNYTVTVSLGTCLSTGSFSVADDALSPSLSASGISANCGLSDGAADLSVNGGTGPFSFVWSNLAVSEDLSNLPPGSYTVTVTGSNSCTAIGTANVLNNNIPLNLNAALVANTSCTAANGSVNITVTPAGTYTYQWSNTATDEDLANLLPGNYTVTVSLGTCQSTSTFAVADNTATPVLSANITASICSANNGAINLSISGTAGPFSFLWSELSTTEDLTSLLPGNYSVTVTAPNGCTEVTTLNVPNNASTFSLAATALPLTNCAVDNGSINLNVTPAGAFTYLWSNMATTEDLSSLPPGTYTVSVTESGSCTATASYFVIDQRSIPLSSQAIVPELCGLTDGSIDLSVSGGTAPFGYLWASGQITQDLANIAAGSYTVTVTDANNCTVTANATVPGNFISFALAGTPSSNSSCLQNNGAIDLAVNPPGGVTYVWSNGSMAEDLNSLNAGTYTVTVSAGGICTNTAVFTIINDQPSPVLSQNIAAALCGQASGSIDLSVSGSPLPNQYNWSNAAIVEDLNGILSGNYTVTVTAANGCSTVENFVVPENTIVPNIGSVLTQSTSCIVNNGAIDLSVTPPSAVGYAFLWSNGAVTEDLTNVAAGNYTVTVNGGGGCTNTASMTVGSTVPLPLLSDNIAAATCGQASGSIDLSVSGSPAPHNYIWSNAATMEDLANIVSGQFSVTVTAANGCTSIGNFTVPENVVAPGLNGLATAANSCLAFNGAVDLTVSFPLGYNVLWSNGSVSEDLSNLASGTYTVTVNGGGACTSTASFSIADQTTQPQAGISAATTALDCSTTSTTLNGSVTGTPNPSSFQWSSNGTPMGGGGSLTVNTPGQYELLVRDEVTFCTATASITVTQNLNPPALSVANPALLTCDLTEQTLSGSSTVGGVQFVWATILGTDTTILGSGTTLQVSAAGTYYLIGLNPANNCANAVWVNVSADQILPSANAGAPFTLDCAGETAPLNGSGSGAPGLVYQWNTQDGHFVSGANAPTPLIDKAGTYQLLVTNPANGCTDTDAVTIVPEIPVAFASVVQPTCLDEQGRVQLDSVTGLSAPILYSLNGSQPSAQNQFVNLVPGTYTLQALGDNGCNATTIVVVEAPDLVEITLVPTATINLGYTYQMEATVNIPDNEIASVNWMPATGLVCDTCLSTEAKPFGTTQYELLVVSKAGCEARGNLLLRVDKTRKIYGPNIFSPDGDGRNDVFTVFADPFAVVRVRSLQVYSRWGEEVFEQFDFTAGDIAVGWDGTFKGQKLNPAVFVWQAMVEFVDGKAELFTGDVTLQR